MTQNGTRYFFNWASNDIRNFLEIGSSRAGSIVLPNGFMEEIVVQDTEGVDKKIPDVTKAYGNTLYYRLVNTANTVVIPNTTGDLGSKTVFIKFNTRNYYDRYGNSEKFPYTLLSYNFDYNTGNLATGQTQGFLLFVDSDGMIKSALFNRAGNLYF